MTRCKHCLSKAEARDGRCSVCGIELHKGLADLSPQEKKVRFHARGIRAVAVFHLIAAGMGIILMWCFPAPLPMAMIALINCILAFGLSRYSLLAYKAATVYYFLIGMVNVISIQRGAVHLAGILLMLVALYLVGNGTSKAIFERTLPEEV